MLSASRSRWPIGLRWFLWGALGTALGASARTQAQAAPVLDPLPTRSAFWAAARNPDHARIEALLQQGRARLSPALGFGLLFGAEATIHRRTGVENALARFERALAIDPRHLHALYLSGKALALWERRTPQGKVERRTREAIERFETLRSVDPLYEAEDVAFELGILLTREEDFRGASEAYERALALRLSASSPSTILGNLAEVSMQAGQLERSVHLYEQASLEGTREERVLSLWGLAVALDRLGESAEAMERAKQALRDDQRPMAVLRQARVFFVPTYESHYYEGLGLLAWAQLDLEAGTSLDHVGAESARMLGRPDTTHTVMLLQHQLGGLQEEGHGDVLRPLMAVVDQRLRKVAPKAKVKLGTIDKKRPAAPEATALLLGVQSLRAFLRFLDRGGEHGPWAVDAHAHIDQLKEWLTPASHRPARIEPRR